MATAFSFYILVVLGIQFRNSESVFLEEPEDVVVLQNDTAMFHCRINHGSQAWIVNGSSNSVQSNPDFTEQYRQSPDFGPPLHTLIIVARSVYNRTTVQCAALFFTNPTEYSSTAVLLIQGFLPSTTFRTISLTNATTLSLVWTPPFSLNLTKHDDGPDLWYCIAILGVCESQEVLSHTNCNVSQPWYNYTYSENSTALFDTFVTYITPVNSLGYGNSSEPASVVIVSASVGVNGNLTSISWYYVDHEVIIELSFPHPRNPCDPRRPMSYSVLVMSSDQGFLVAVYSTNITTVENSNITNLMLRYADDILPFYRNYMVQIRSTNSAGSTNSTGIIQFSTHSIQNLTVSNSSLSGAVFIMVAFTHGPSSIGYLAILFNDNGSYTFRVSYRPAATLTFTDLYRSQHTAAVFDIAANGLPTAQAAATRQFRVHTGKIFFDINPVISDPYFVVNENSEGLVCIECIFPKTSFLTVKGCITLIHSVDQPSVLAVYNITRPSSTTSDVITRSSLCVDERITTGRHFSIAVFVWRNDGVIAQTPSTVVNFPNVTIGAAEACDSECKIVSVSVAGIVLVGAGMGVCIVISFYMSHHKKKVSPPCPQTAIPVESNTAYVSHAQRPTVVDPAIQQNDPLYETII